MVLFFFFQLSNYKFIKVRYLVIMISPNNLFRGVHFSMLSMQRLNPKTTFVTRNSTHFLQVFKSKLTHKSTPFLQVFKSRLTTCSSVLVLICKLFKTPLQYH